MASNGADEDFTLARAHGTVMVFSWMVFASTGVLFVRYGRSVRFNQKKQLLGEDIWFQVHRFSLVLAVIGTLLGFFLVLAQAGGKWVSEEDDGSRLFAHSILGAIIVGCALIQAWMALFRCHPDSPFRYIFNWIHRTTGMLPLILSIPTIFIVIYVLLNYHDGLVTILSLWTAWIVIIFIVFEVVEYRIRSMPSTNVVRNWTNGIGLELNNEHSSGNRDAQDMQALEHAPFNMLKITLFLLNFCVALCLVIPLIVLLWLQG